jgi:tRNA A37 threonylcarbamoyltransferase TsaD
MQQAARPLGLPVFFPSPRFCTDNGAMIACAAFYRYHTDPHAYRQQNVVDLDAMTNMTLTNVETIAPV